MKNRSRARRNHPLIEALEVRKLLAYSLSPNPASIGEGAGTLNFTITRSGTFPAETLFVSPVQGSTNGYASNSSDYSGLLNQTVSFATNQTQATVSVSITNDSVVESNETFGLVVQRNSTDAVSTYLAKSTFTIND